MGETTKIQWTDATLNFWWGCTKVGPGCDNCYAEAWSKRTGETIWGPGAPRRKIKSAFKTAYNLAQRSLNQSEEGKGRIKVFVQSMSDIFDNEVDPSWMKEALIICEDMHSLNFQLLTKRVSNVEKMIPAHWRFGNWPSHIGLMITVVNQQEADRDIPRLLKLKADFGVPWVGLSMEPLLGDVDLSAWLWGRAKPCPDCPKDGDCACGFSSRNKLEGEAAIDWVIVGGESGRGARPMHPDWARSIRDQCKAAGTAFFFKQWGEYLPIEAGPESTAPGGYEKVGKDKAGRKLEGLTHDTFPGALLP